jgi:hypothetical protein
VGWQVNIPNQPDCKKEHLADLNLDLTKNLNDQGYYGPFPNDADPRTSWRHPPRDDKKKEYREWVENWVAAHNSQFDNEQMKNDRRKKLIADRRARGDMSTMFLEYW